MNPDSALPRPQLWRTACVLAVAYGLLKADYGFRTVFYFASHAEVTGVVDGVLSFAAGTLLIGTWVAALAGRGLPARLLLGVTALQTAYSVVFAVATGTIQFDGTTTVANAIYEGLAWLLAVYFVRPLVSAFATGREDPGRRLYETLLSRLDELHVASLAGKPQTSRLVKPFFAAVLILYVSWDSTPTAIVATLAALLLHELGHVLAFRVYGHRLKAFHFLPFGLGVEPEGSFRSFWQETIIALSGPLTNAALAVGSLAAYGHTHHEWFRTFAIINGGLGLLNILPITPLDGGRVMRGMTFSMPVFFQWSYLGFSMILLAGAAILLEAWMLLILILPFVAEARLFGLYQRLAREQVFPTEAAMFLGEPMNSTMKTIVSTLKVAEGSAAINTTILMFKMRYGPRMRWAEVLSAGALAATCLVANVWTTALATESRSPTARVETPPQIAPADVNRPGRQP